LRREGIDGLLRDHAAIGDEDEAVDREGGFQPFDLWCQSGGIGRIAVMDRDRDGTAADIGQQAVIDLQRALFPVTAVAAFGERTGGAFIIAGGEVVERHGALLEMACGELLLDPVLPFEQPVHRVVELLLVGVFDGEGLGQGGVGPPTDGGELGVGRDDAGGDHRLDEIALAAGPGRQQSGDAELVHRPGHRLDMAMAARPGDLEGVGRRDEGLALEAAADEIDDVVRQVREVAEGLVADGRAVAIAAAEEMGAVGLPVIVTGRSCYICRT
jgi:hypothetical protein